MINFQQTLRLRGTILGESDTYDVRVANLNSTTDIEIGELNTGLDADV